MMTRQHYIEVARILVATVKDAAMRKDLCEEFADLFKRDNRRFDIDRFRTACNV